MRGRGRTHKLQQEAKVQRQQAAQEARDQALWDEYNARMDREYDEAALADEGYFEREDC